MLPFSVNDFCFFCVSVNLPGLNKYCNCFKFLNSYLELDLLLENKTMCFKYLHKYLHFNDFQFNQMFCLKFDLVARCFIHIKRCVQQIQKWIPWRYSRQWVSKVAITTKLSRNQITAGDYFVSLDVIIHFIFHVVWNQRKRKTCILLQNHHQSLLRIVKALIAWFRYSLKLK